jgi:dephospho-CoA kinase
VTCRVVERFGEEVRQSDGAINRRALGAIVFGNPAALRDLEAIVHPHVGLEIARRIQASAAGAIVVDAIKLLESDLAGKMDLIWVVTCPPELQMRRLVLYRGLSESEAVARIRSQGPQEEKVRRADFVIDNSGSREELEQQVVSAFEESKKRKPTHSEKVSGETGN